jgi:hypothetical protein
VVVEVSYKDAVLWHSGGPIKIGGSATSLPAIDARVLAMLVYCALKVAGIGKIVADGAPGLNMGLGGSRVIDDDIPLCERRPAEGRRHRVSLLF